MDAPDTTPFNKALHTKYWLRCLHFHLPTAYTPTDAQRMTLAFFILSALDLLGALHTSATSHQRAAYVAWIYRCQHPRGGFRGFTGADAATEGGGEWDPANVAATYFALASLAVLGDDLGGVRRRECLEWVREMQDVDGSFGEVKIGGRIEGGRDVRFCYCASAVRWMLGGGNERGEGDIDVEGLVGFVKGSQVSFTLTG
jgi:geranylgeranyl transferase type-1 subunit beta